MAKDFDRRLMERTVEMAQPGFSTASTESVL
jgi:hypothetical protein